jgi:prealbumin domain-containing protein
MKKLIPSIALCLSLGFVLTRGSTVSARMPDLASPPDAIATSVAPGFAELVQQYPQPTIRRTLPAAPTVSQAATVQTDKFDYRPGENAIITGAGFEPGEAVVLQVQHASGQADGDGHEPFTTVADPAGQIAEQWYVNPDDSRHAIFILTAEGTVSGRRAVTIFTDSAITLVDDQGPDDYPGQKDLNFFTFDYGLPGATSISVSWGWDDTAWPGGNTGDACTLFDTNADGKANYSLCVTVAGIPAAYQSIRLYSCSNGRSDRCTQPTLIPAAQTTSTAGAAVVAGSDPFGKAGGPHFSAAHVTGNTCGNTPGCYTDDTVAVVTVRLADMGGTTAKLLNVCSYPSSEPNSAPSECVITPNNGFLTIVKNATPSDSTQFTFNLGSGQVSQDGTSSWTITGSNQVQFISFTPSTTNDLSEAIPTGWNLDSASCAIQTSPTTSTGTFASPTISNFGIVSGLETICTFNDSIQKGSLIIKKQVVNDNGGTKKATDFSFSVNGGAATTFAQDGADPLKGKNTITIDPGTTYNVTEPAVGGYDTSYSGCSSIVVAAGGSATCTITNDDQAATLIVKKVVVNNNGGGKVATDFSFKVDGAASGTAFLQDGADTLKGKNTLSVNAGSHTVVEVPVTGYTTTYDNCTNVSIANGGTATCTITNTDSKAAPGGSTTQRAVLHDSITITGIRAGASDAASATATFRLYSDAACGTQVGSSEVRPVAVATGTASTVNGVQVNGNGIYRWRVQYSGDAFNTGFNTACGDETTTVTFGP